MSKTILIIGATNGIGLETAKLLAADGHLVLLHGRNPKKLKNAAEVVGGETERYIADLSRIDDMEALAECFSTKHDKLDVLVTNAGIYTTLNPTMPDGLDIRSIVNMIAPYVLTKLFLPLMDSEGRIINLSSAAQASVDVNALASKATMSDMDAYSQSKLAIKMWSLEMARELTSGPRVLAVNPGSVLAGKMVKEGCGVAGIDLRIGAKLLHHAALSDDFADASGKYYHNDAEGVGNPHLDALNQVKASSVTRAIESTLH